MFSVFFVVVGNSNGAKRGKTWEIGEHAALNLPTENRYGTSEKRQAWHGDTLNENDYDIIELNFDIVMHHAYAKLPAAAAAVT